MRKLPIFAISALLTASLLSAPTAAAEEPLHEQLKQRILQPKARTLALDEGAGNGIYRVHVEGHDGLAPGTFTVLTGEDNPAGEGLNVLFGNGVPGTSYMTVRQTDGDGNITDWVQGQLITHADERSLDDYYWYTEDLDTGFVTHWSSIWFPDISQRVEVVGSTAADSRVEVTTTIALEDAPNDQFQVQYIWDLAVGQDDGPVLQELPGDAAFSPYEPVITTERVFEDSTRLAVADNDGNPVPPNLATEVATSSDVESIKYACWPDAIYAEFGEYEVWDAYDVSTTDSDCINTDGDNDSAVVTVFAAGQQSVTGTLAMTPPEPYSTKINAKPVLLRLTPAFSATLTDAAEGEPLASKEIEFVVGRTVRCTAVTDENGVATCGTLTDALAAVLALGYTARYGGGAIWAAISDRGGIA